MVAWELSSLLKEDAILMGDAGSVAYWISRCVKLRPPQRFSKSGTHCTLGCGLSYAMGACCAFPNRQVVALVGDGALMQVLADLATLAQYKLPAKIIVLKNGRLTLERWQQMMFLGNPEAKNENEFNEVDFCRIAQALGVDAVRISDHAQCRSQLKAALDHPGPFLVECDVSPDEPALETPLAGSHAVMFGKAFAQDMPDKEAAAKGLLDALREEQEFLPEAIDAQTKVLMKELAVICKK